VITVKKLTSKVNRMMIANVRFVAAALGMIVFLNVISAIQETAARGGDGSLTASDGPSVPGGGGGGTKPGVVPRGSTSAPGGTSGRGGATGPGNIFGGKKPGTFIPGIGHVPNGIHGNKIDVVYYWKGDRSSEASAFLGATGQKGQLDEAEAFYKFVAYINAHPNGSHTFMGFRFNMHGWQLNPIVVDAGQYPDTYYQATQTIIKKNPFAAISSHGGLSDYICPKLAAQHIFNPVTYNLYPGLVKKTGGWCLPASMSWERQVRLTLDWIGKQSKTPYQVTAATTAPRVYGILYAEYPGLGDAILGKGGLRDQFKKAGVNIKSVYSIPEGLADSASPASSVVDKFKSDGVNTIIDPDAGALITFTHAAAGKGYAPDYFVWPCSGQDAAGQVRLYDASQWSRASGLSCFDDNWNLDLTLDDNARKTQWFKQYRQMAQSHEDPPSTAPLVYAGILPVLAGITNAGAKLSVERFFAGLEKFRGYRYNAVTGATKNPSNFLVTSGEPDGSQIGDVAEVSWSNTTTTSGNATAGAYLYSNKRWKPGEKF
jgi:hypothetical protein